MTRWDCLRLYRCCCRNAECCQVPPPLQQLPSAAFIPELSVSSEIVAFVPATPLISVQHFCPLTFLPTFFSTQNFCKPFSKYVWNSFHIRLSSSHTFLSSHEFSSSLRFYSSPGLYLFFISLAYGEDLDRECYIMS